MQPTDIKRYLSGGSSNTDPNLSLGDEVSSTEVSSTPLNNLFDNVTAAERTSGIEDYRCLYIKNEHPTSPLIGARIYVSTQTPASDTVVAIALDPEGIGDGSSTGVAEIIPDEVTAPVNAVFAPPNNSYATALVIGDMDPGECQAIWVKRTVNVGAVARLSDNFVLTVTGVPDL